MANTASSLWWQGYKATVPLMIGVAPFGVVFGALAVKNAEMTPLEALGMSIFVLAGSSQFVAAQLIDENTPILIIVLTTFIINLRHFLYSASLANFLRPLSTTWKAILGYMMVDEVYVPVMIQHNKGEFSPSELRWYFFGAGSNLISVWWLTTIIGAVVGDVLPDDTAELLGFTLPLIFTSIIVPMWIKRPMLVAGLVGGISSIILAPLPYRLGLLVAALIGITAGVMAENRLPKEEQAA